MVSPGRNDDSWRFLFQCSRAIALKLRAHCGHGRQTQKGEGLPLSSPITMSGRLMNGSRHSIAIIKTKEMRECSIELQLGMAAQIRFREWGQGEEALSFSIWLSRGDVWVGTLTRNPQMADPDHQPGSYHRKL